MGWIDIFAINQANPTTKTHDLSELKNTVKTIGHTLMILDEKAFALTRVWCLFEVLHTIQNGAKLELAFMSNVDQTDVERQDRQASFIHDYILCLLACAGRYDK